MSYPNNNRNLINYRYFVKSRTRDIVQTIRSKWTPGNVVSGESVETPVPRTFKWRVEVYACCVSLNVVRIRGTLGENRRWVLEETTSIPNYVVPGRILDLFSSGLHDPSLVGHLTLKVFPLGTGRVFTKGEERVTSRVLTVVESFRRIF